MTSRSTPSEHLNPVPAQGPEDVMLVGMLKAMWAKYGHLPKVRQAFGIALADGQVTPLELATLKTSIALALAQEMGGWSAYVESGPDPRILAELEQALLMAPDHPEVAATIKQILADGQVSGEELKQLRAALAEASQLDARGPQTRVRQPPPPRPSMPGRIPVKKDGDEEDEN